MSARLLAFPLCRLPAGVRGADPPLEDLDLPAQVGGRWLWALNGGAGAAQHAGGDARDDVSEAVNHGVISAD